VPLHFALVIHAHQPVGNFDHVLEQAYRNSYLPFVETLARFPGIRLTLHYSGCLLEWLVERHPKFLRRLRRLVERGQVELLGGGFYEPILVSIPEEDRQAQLRLLSDFVRKHFGRRPRGIWLTERVWEPTLPATLRAAGVEFTLTDDQHFLAAGLDPEDLYGYYLTEDLGAPLKIIPGSKTLRYLIPFHPVAETLNWLRGVAERHPEGLAAMGDDCEKFGVWPGTHNLCYREGWLEDFFGALEASRDWLKTVTASDYIDSHPPRGPVYLPTASYTEMTEWALPTPARLRFQRVQRATEQRGDTDEMQFLRGGFWRNFFSKYSEARFLHRRMLAASARVRRATASGRGRKIAAGYRHVLRGQCNDAYWHGIFGGLYSPHLRTAVYRSLLEAERSVGEKRRKNGVEWEFCDYDLDGSEELVGRGRGFVVWFDRNDGGTLGEIDLLRTATPLVNSLRRRPEAYHEELRALESKQPGEEPGRVRTIHEMAAAKEAGLSAALVYDRYERHAFRLLVFPPQKQLVDFHGCALEENEELAGGDYELVAKTARGLRVERRARAGAPGGLEARKDFSFRATPAGGIEITCEVRLQNPSDTELSAVVGVEVVINLLAPEAPDRYLAFGRARHPLRWLGEMVAREVRLVDEYQGVEVALEASEPAAWWCAPIESVSQSEAGFEKVYQGSALMPVWRVELAGRASWQGRVVLRARPRGG
jgi:alpha-amylase